MNTRFPSIDAKTALQNGELFLYQSLRFDLVRVTGVEPARHVAQDPKSCASANSAIPAYIRRHNALKYTLPLAV